MQPGVMHPVKGAVNVVVLTTVLVDPAQLHQNFQIGRSVPPAPNAIPDVVLESIQAEC